MRLLLIASLLLVSHLSANAEDQVTLTKGEQSVTVHIGDEVFTVFQFSKDRKKPFFLPVTGPGGDGLLDHATPGKEGTAGRKVIVCSENPQTTDNTGNPVDVVSLNDVFEVQQMKDGKAWIEDKNVWISLRDVAPVAATVTRLINDNPVKIKDRKSPLYYDHPHHKGVWLSVDEVNGIKFWNEDGRINNVSVEVVKASGSPAILKYENHWMDQDGKPLVKEVSTMSLYPNRLMAVDVTFTAVQDEVTFGDTKEGMFAIRLPNSMREMVAGGPVKNSHGDQGTGACWGKPANWIDYCGPIDGQVFGVTLMDHPENPRPSRYHVRDYGLFGINPFGIKAYSKGAEEAAPLTLKEGESTRFRYGLFVHAEVLEDAEIEAVYQQFTQ